MIARTIALAFLMAFALCTAHAQTRWGKVIREAGIRGD